MSTILFLVGFPLVVAIVLLMLKEDVARDIVVKVAAGVIVVASIYLVVENFKAGETLLNIPFAGVIGIVMMALEVTLAIVIITIGLMKKRYLAPLFAAIQTPLLLWFELGKGHGIKVENNICVDRLSMIMVLIIGIIGSLICVYALGYMKDFQKHHIGTKDRRPWFFFLMFLFLSAMFGLVMSNNLIWLYFFWEITSLCSFFMIGFNGLFHKEDEDKIATRNAFRALTMNLAGGLSFVIAIILLGNYIETLELSAMLDMRPMPFILVIVAMFLAFAGITKAAQMPFNSWLLGAMVAPTPTSALLHSSTMVKAGVFLILKLAPILGSTGLSSFMVAMVGGITFLMASFAAISQSNAKKVLAYSTVANLGLIVACGGIGTPGAVWAGIMLMIFHAIIKSLLFLCVGTAEHNIGSRDIEDMDGLFERMPRLASFMLIGIAGMFLAPFGMLISKWATLIAFIDVNVFGLNVILIAIICYGGAATAFYWTKWLGKLAGIMASRENIQKKVRREENIVQLTLSILTIVMCLSFPFVSKIMVVPYLADTFPAGGMAVLSANNMIIMVLMIAVLVLLFAFLFGRTNKKIVPIYMSGVNVGDNLRFVNSMEGQTEVSLRNWYLEEYFGEFKMNVIGVIATAITLVITMGMVVGAIIGGGV